MVLMLLGISLFGAITATITSYLITRDIQQLEEHEAESSLAGELERLVELYAAGALTDEEFAAAKSNLLTTVTRSREPLPLPRDSRA